MSVEITSDGGYIVAGYTSSFDPGYNQFDGWLMKYASDGTLEWEKIYVGALNDRFMDVKITVDNGYIITGYSDSFGAGNQDIWIVKVSESGTIQWQKTYGGSGVDYAKSIKQTTDGGYIVDILSPLEPEIETSGC